MARFCIKEALSYDIRVMPTLLDEHSAVMRQVCDSIAGITVSDVDFTRLQVPGALSGLGSTVPTTSTDAAYVATWQATMLRVKALYRILCRPIRRCEGEEAVKRRWTD